MGEDFAVVINYGSSCLQVPRTTIQSSHFSLGLLARMRQPSSMITLLGKLERVALKLVAGPKSHFLDLKL
jgi:hypothetical protein